MNVDDGHQPEAQTWIQKAIEVEKYEKELTALQ